jgi:gluconolactonase
MKVDTAGNIYAAATEGVAVITPQGKQLGILMVPEIVANLAWGDADGKTLYITARTGVYRIKLNATGIRP